MTLVGPVSPEQVWDEYAGADLFVYPSQLESFGLPPLEAMAAGVPVIASAAPAVREVVGDAARVVDVTDRESFATGIEELLASASGARSSGRPAGDGSRPGLGTMRPSVCSPCSVVRRHDRDGSAVAPVPGPRCPAGGREG